MDRLKKYTKQLNIMILVVEDDRDMLELVERELRANGFENPRFFTDPEEAIEVAKRDGPAICILDYYLHPRLNGRQLLLRLRKLNQDCYFIGFTGLADLEVIRQWVNAGLNKWVNKNSPNYLGELSSYIKEAIAKIKDDWDLHSEILRQLSELKTKRKQNESRSHS